MTDTAWEHVNSLLAIRSGSRCEGCGEPFVPGKVEPSRHHRNPGRMGGKHSKYNPDHDSPANLLLLCGGRLAGVRGCHGEAESYRTRAYQRGFLVHDWEDPETVPVELWSGRVVLLDPVGCTYLNPPDQDGATDTPLYAPRSA